MTTKLNETRVFFASTQLEAEGLVNAAKKEEGSYIKKTSIDKKVKKETEYFVVIITVEYGKAKDFLD